MIYNMNREMNWIRELEDGCQEENIIKETYQII